jgi:hypothetical protein
MSKKSQINEYSDKFSLRNNRLKCKKITYPSFYRNLWNLCLTLATGNRKIDRNMKPAGLGNSRIWTDNFQKSGPGTAAPEKVVRERQVGPGRRGRGLGGG